MAYQVVINCDFIGEVKPMIVQNIVNGHNRPSLKLKMLYASNKWSYCFTMTRNSSEQIADLILGPPKEILCVVVAQNF